jgi:hypothetical protein
MPLKPAESQSAWGICSVSGDNDNVIIHARCTPLRASCPFALAHSVHCLLDLNPHPHCPTFVLQQVHCRLSPSVPGSLPVLSPALRLPVCMPSPAAID